MSAMRTDDRDLNDGVSELRTQDGYFVDSSSDEALSENSFSSLAGEGNVERLKTINSAGDSFMILKTMRETANCE
jgi:hypothetical protein